jgi:hypothetical protein
MKIDASADHPISRMYRSEEYADRIANRDPEGRASRARTSGRAAQTQRDILQISSPSTSSFSSELSQGLTKAEKPGPADQQVRKPNSTGRTGTEAEQSRSAGAAEKPAGDAKEGKPKIVSTPIGVFDMSTKGPNKYVSLTGISEMRTYFMTHQPADWMYNEKARAEFAKIYGEKALVTLDWDGTVPENNDPVWVTKRPIGPDGIPLPGYKPSTTLT